MIHPTYLNVTGNMKNQAIMLVMLACMATACVESSIRSRQPDVPTPPEDGKIAPQETMTEHARDTTPTPSSTDSVPNSLQPAQQIPSKPPAKALEQAFKVVDSYGFNPLPSPEAAAALGIQIQMLDDITPSAGHEWMPVSFLKKSKALFLSGKTEEADAFISSNWSVIANDKLHSKIKSYDVAEAHYIRGRVNFDIASRANDNSQDTKKRLENSIACFHFVLSSSDPDSCPFFSSSLKLFKAARDLMQSKFNTKIPFPPEF